MMKILHSADWHLDAPLRSLPPEQSELVRGEMRKIPQRIARLCREQDCQLVLLAGDLFDGPYTRESLDLTRQALEEMDVPVFIAPGNHDPIWEKSPYITEHWPENVHIFKNPTMEAVTVEALDCRVYGGAFHGSHCPGLLEDFLAQGQERYALGVLHGDPVMPQSPYCPITAGQVERAGLDYLALGHIHATGSFRAGAALAAWPGCTMGHGFDETGPKGALVVTLEEQARAEFVPLEGIRFYDLEAAPETSLSTLLPAVESRDFYRITLTGQQEPPDLKALREGLSRFPNLTLRDRTRPPADLWADAGEDSLQGTFFRILRDSRQGQDEETVQSLELAAKIARQLLLGQEVLLP